MVEMNEEGLGSKWEFFRLLSLLALGGTGKTTRMGCESSEMRDKWLLPAYLPASQHVFKCEMQKSKLHLAVC